MLPAPFIIPLYAHDERHKGYIAAALSAQTPVSPALFIGVAVYSPA